MSIMHHLFEMLLCRKTMNKHYHLNTMQVKWVSEKWCASGNLSKSTENRVKENNERQPMLIHSDFFQLLYFSHLYNLRNRDANYASLHLFPQSPLTSTMSKPDNQ